MKKRTLKATKKSRPNFFIGFEFEGTVTSKHLDAFEEGLRSINPNIGIGDDSSILCANGRDAVEIRTPKLSLSKGKELLDEVLSYLYSMTMAGVFKTNESCGLHINVSESRMFKSGVLMQKEYYTTVASRFKEREISEKFKRSNNRYCKLLNIPKNIIGDKSKLIKYMNTPKERTEYEKPIGYKYLACALRPKKFQSIDNMGQTFERIEFRCLGNKNYQLKTTEINDSLSHIHECMSTSFRELSS